MRCLVGFLAVFPIIAVAQNLGTYQIGNGTIVSLGGANNITSDGFTLGIQGYPGPLFAGGIPVLAGSEINLSVGFQPPLFNDPGMYMSILSEPVALADEGLVPFEIPPTGPFGAPSPYTEETGAITTPLLDVAEPGTYQVPFTMSMDAYFGAPGSGTPSGYVNFVGNGEVTVDITDVVGGNESCTDLPGICLYRVASVDYAFAPELDPASIGGGLTLLVGGLLVIRGRRARAPQSSGSSPVNRERQEARQVGREINHRLWLLTESGNRPPVWAKSDEIVSMCAGSDWTPVGRDKCCVS